MKLANTIRLRGLTIFSGDNPYTHICFSSFTRCQSFHIFLSLVLLLLCRSEDPGILTLALIFHTRGLHPRLT